MVGKEFIQLRRDRVTFAMIVGIPIIQLTLFGYAINTDPKHLPTAVIAADHSEFTRSLVQAMRTSDYFRIVGELPNEQAGRDALARGDVQFVLSIPPNFTRALLRGERPAVLLEADATDPTATGAAIATVNRLASVVAAKDLSGALRPLAGTPPPFDIIVHRRLQPGGDHPVQHRPRSDGCDPDHDAGADDRTGDHPRARARHHGEPARHAVDVPWRS